MLRVVVDPGVLIAALISRRGAPAELLASWAEGLFDLVVSPMLLDELAKALSRPKFRRYATEEEVRDYVESLRRRAALADDPSEIEPGLTPDPGDDYLVALARAARAQVLVSGDPHLTGLDDPRPPVMTPRAFLDRLHRSD
jgi:uncharacterized protein